MSAVDSALHKKKTNGGSKDERKKDSDPLAPKGEKTGGVGATGRNDDDRFPKERETILELCRAVGFSPAQGGEIARDWRKITAKLPSRAALEHFASELYFAADRTENPVNHPAAWCLAAAVSGVKSGTRPLAGWPVAENVVAFKRDRIHQGQLTPAGAR